MSNLYEQRVAVLQDRIEDLYEVFRKYPLHPKTNSLPISKAHLSVKGIRNLPVQAFYEYLSSAMNRWGNVEDFKRFVPRLLELLVTNWPSDTFMMLSRFRVARWRQWPSADREAVEQFFMALWLVRLAQPFGNNSTTIDEDGYTTCTWMSLPAECFFIDLEYVYEDFEPFLRRWDEELENATDPFSLRLHLVWLVLHCVYDGKIPEEFPVPIQKSGSPRLCVPDDWLFTSAHAKLLEDAYYRWPDKPEAKSFSHACELMQSFIAS